MVSLRATLNCEAFADAHRAESHFDRSSFVGLAWRPPGESCCVEIYSTGRANIPGSRTERALNKSFSRMLPELLRFSSSSRLLTEIPDELQAVHRGAITGVVGAPVTMVPAPKPKPKPKPNQNESDEEEGGEEGGEGEEGEEGGGLELEDSVLASLGL